MNTDKKNETYNNISIMNQSKNINDYPEDENKNIFDSTICGIKYH